MKKPAKFWKTLPDKRVQCILCPRNCMISPGKVGFCRGRINEDGKLYTQIYGVITSMAADPIEKKPLYHFWPGSTAFSIGTVGCNFSCRHCFIPETLVVTNNGVFSIKEIFEKFNNTNPIKVLTHTGRMLNVKKCIKHDYVGEVIKIQPRYLPKIVCTPDHKLFVTKDPHKCKVKKLEAALITQNHFLAVPKLFPGSVNELDVKEIFDEFKAKPFRIYRKITREDYQKIKSMLNDGLTSQQIGKILSLNPAYVRNLLTKVRRKGEKEAFRDESPSILIEGGTRVRFKNEKGRGVKRYIKITPAFSKLLGLYCAEGCVRKIYNRPNTYDLVFSFGHKELDLAEITKKLLSNVLEVDADIRKEATALKVYVRKTSAALLFKLLCGDNVAEKHVPDFIFKTNKPVTGAFLRGYFEGDGTFKRDYTDAITISKQLALGVCSLLLKQGVVPAFYTFIPSKTKKIGNRTIRQSIEYIVRLPSQFDFEVGAWIRKRKLGYFENKRYFFVPVRKISKESYSGEVFNFEVAGDHSYTASFSAVSNCQNWTISQTNINTVAYEEITPERVIELTKRYDCQGIAYTYIEPAIWFEFCYDTAKLAHKEGLYNVYVTNGYMSLDAWKEIRPYLDAANVDVKAFSDRFYKEICGVPGGMKPVLDTCKWMVKDGVHLETTYLVIPGENDGAEEIRKFCKWSVEELGPFTPTHFSRFYPQHKMTDREPTPVKTLEMAMKIAHEEGLRYVYIGNVPGHEGDNTYCHKCGELLIERYGFDVTKYSLKNKHCPKCKSEISIVGKYTPSKRSWF